METNLKTIFPYIKRLQRLHPELKACVFEYKNSFKKQLEDSNLFKTIGDDPEGAHLVLFGFNKLEKEITPDFWEKMTIEGWVAVVDSEKNFELVNSFRKINKITSLLTRINGVIFFQKEDYSERGKSKSSAEIELEKMEFESFPVEVTVPDWRNSHLKDDYIRRYGNGKIFVETGTYLGQTVEMVRRSKLFEEIFSIELEPNLWKKAATYFDFDPQIKILQGDSVDKVAEICENLKDEPATFWLDAHASGPLSGGRTGPNPLVEELTAIKNTGRTDHTILVDDRRLFGTSEWGGLPESEVMRLINEINPDYTITYLDGEVPQDIICASVVNKEFEVVPDIEPIPEGIKKLFKLDEPKTETKPKPKLIFMD